MSAECKTNRRLEQTLRAAGQKGAARMVGRLLR